MKVFLRKYANWVYLSSLAGVYIEPAFLLLRLIFDVFNFKIYRTKIPCYILFLLVHGVVMSLFTGYDITMLISQCILLAITLLGYNQLFIRSGRDIKLWFEQYLKFAYIISFIGIVDLGVYYWGGYPILTRTLDMWDLFIGLRLKSCLLEPGYVTMFLTPAVAYIFFDRDYFKDNKYKSIIIVSAILLTFSTSLLFVFLIVFFFKFWIRYRKQVMLILSIFTMLTIMLFSYLKKIDIEGQDSANAINKLVQTLQVSEYATPYDFELLNASSYSQLTNMWIAFHAPCRIMGTGLGTHSQNYEKLYKSDYYLYGLNKNDGYSVFTRMLSEFGYIGVIVYVYVLYRLFNRKSIYSFCFLTAIIVTFIRGGNYTLYCIALFHYLYYQCWKFRQIDN